jgi:hypothetical protein
MIPTSMTPGCMNDCKHQNMEALPVLVELGKLLRVPEGECILCHSRAGAVTPESADYWRREYAREHDAYLNLHAEYLTLLAGDRGAAPPTDEMVKLVRDMIAADIVENGAGVRTIVVREALSAILSPGSTPLPPTPTLTTAQQGNVNELEMGDGLYYVAQEAAFAPGIVKEWPAVIKHPKDKNGRLVRRKWPKSGGLSQGEPTE